MVAMETDQVHVYHLKTYPASLTATVVVTGMSARNVENCNDLGLEEMSQITDLP